MLGIDPLSVGPSAYANVGVGHKVTSLDVRKMDKWFGHPIVKRFAGWASKQYSESRCTVDSIENMITAVCTSFWVATPWGVTYRPAFRGVPSGTWIVQQMQSWLSAVIAVRAALQLGEELSFNPIVAYATLGDDIFVEHDDSAMDAMEAALFQTAVKFGLELKPEIHRGTRDRFDLLGYEIIKGSAYSKENKLIAGLVWPERCPPDAFTRRSSSPGARREAASAYDKHQSCRAVGYSQVNAGLWPSVHKLCELMVQRQPVSEADIQNHRSSDFRQMTLPPRLWSHGDQLKRSATSAAWRPHRMRLCA